MSGENLLNHTWAARITVHLCSQDQEDPDFCEKEPWQQLLIP